MNEKINDNLKQLSTWKRIFFMAIFSVIVGLVRILLWGVILLQVASMLFSGKVNENILYFGKSLSAYLYHVLLFLTFNTDTIPFPFSDWALTEALDLPKIKKDV